MQRLDERFSSEAEQRWNLLCTANLPLIDDSSFWRFNRQGDGSDLEQGWKIHITTTILKACDTFVAIAPVLRRSGVMFKGPKTLNDIKKLNCGLFAGYSQIGKCFTVYPRNDKETVSLADELHRVTEHLTGPMVPFDNRLVPKSNVFYRYGAHSSRLKVVVNGEEKSAIRTPDGELVVDERGPDGAIPFWVRSPFPRSVVAAKARVCSRFTDSFKVFKALSQRGKGGVYTALDITSIPMRLCVLKEGRRLGEVDWDGKDGFWRIKNEAKALEDLRRYEVPVPIIYSEFRQRHSCYVAMEHLDGKNLQELCASSKITIERRVNLCFQMARLVSKIHEAGWVWRDCKPLNFMVCTDDQLRPLDFEGAVRRDRSFSLPWGTAGYVPPEWLSIRQNFDLEVDDLFALGASFLHVVTQSPPPTNHSDMLAFARQTLPKRRIPEAIQRNIMALIQAQPSARPKANKVYEELSKCLKSPQNPHSASS